MMSNVQWGGQIFADTNILGLSVFNIHVNKIAEW